VSLEAQSTLCEQHIESASKYLIDSINVARETVEDAARWCGFKDAVFTMIVIASATPYFLLFVVPLGYIYLSYQKY
jgi:hypothetical protein